MSNERRTAVFYSAAICNLNCIYCSIDKNPILVQIDKQLEESFKGDYYISFLKELFPDPQQLIKIETWGGEPSMGWHRMIPLLHQVIDFYPNFSEFFSSTNMVYEKFHEELEGIINVFKEYPNRQFKLILQLSLDGTEEINDTNRGKGVTRRLSASFDKLINETLKTIPNNVTFETYFKATLDLYSIKELQTKDAIIDYYKFFESFYDKFNNVYSGNMDIRIFPTMPNTATPAQHTVEDGKLFANLCKLCYEIERTEPLPFKYFKNIMPYNGNAAQDVSCIVCDGFTCGTCKYIVGLLPNNMVSGCNSAFVDLLQDYKKNIMFNGYKNKVLDYGIFEKESMNFFLFDKSKLEQRAKQMDLYYNKNTTARLVSMKVLIQSLAYAEQVDEKFKNDELALQAADLICRNATSCMKDNIGANGTMTIPSISILRLLLNGAFDYIKVPHEN